MNFQEFYNSIDKNTLKIHVQKDSYILYEREIDRLTASGYSLPSTFLNENNIRYIKLSKPEIENVIKYSLINIKIPVTEIINTSEGFSINRSGTPSNWNDYHDICINESMIPSLAFIFLKIEDKNKIFITVQTENTFQQTEFNDDDIYSHLFCVLTGFNVTECVINDKRLERPLLSMGIVVNFCKFNNKSEEDPNVRTSRLSLKEKEENNNNTKDNLSTKLMKYYLCRQDFQVTEMQNPLSYVIDSFTLSVLNPIKYFNCYTSQGKRLLEQFIRNPLLNKEDILVRQKLTTEFLTLQTNQLKSISDLSKISKQLQNKRCLVDNFIKLEENLCKIRSFISEIKNNTEIKENTMLLLSNIKPFRDEINKFINKEGFINEINNKLKELHNELRSIKKEKIKEKERILEKNKKIKFLENNFKISRNDFKIFEDEFKRNKFLELSFLKSGVVFTTKEMERLNELSNNVINLINLEEKSIITGLNEYGSNFCGILDAINHMIAQIDVFHAFSEKINEGWTFPTIEDSFILNDAFHPQIKIGNVPNSIELKDKHFVIITGPNMGGKSTFLRIVGMIVLLSQIGAPVPASKAAIPLFDSILIRIGANDCPSRHKSTFLNEMEEVSKIIHRCTSNSLVLIDELGRGTSDIDGLSIAMAVKEYLVKKSAYVFFTTHFTELCTEECINKRIEVFNDKIFYKLVDGIGDSYGIGVAKMVNFPEEVIKEAEGYLRD